MTRIHSRLVSARIRIGDSIIQSQRRIVLDAVVPLAAIAAAATMWWKSHGSGEDRTPSGDAYESSRVGLYANLILFPHLWVNRRVVRIDFDTNRSYLRQTSIDFTIPDWMIPERRGQAIAPIPIPLQILHKRSEGLKQLSLRDEGGRVVPVRLTDENQELAVAALSTLYQQAGGRHLRAVQPSIHRFVTTKDVCTDTHTCDANPCGPRVAETVIADVLKSWETDQQRLAADAFQALAATVAENYLLTAWSAVRSGERRVLKLSYENTVVVASRLSLRHPIRWFRRVFRALGKAFGLFAVPFDFPVSDLSDTATLHVEVHSPDGLFIDRAQLRAQDAKGISRRVRQAEASCGPCKRAHLYASRQPRGVKGRALVRVRLDPSGWPTVAWAAAALTVLLLVGSIVRDVPSGRTPTTSGASILLLVPGLLAGQLFRPGEHQVARWVARGVRVVAFLILVVSVSAAGLLAAPPVPQGIWYGLTITMILMLLMVTVVYLVSSIKLRREGHEL